MACGPGHPELSKSYMDMASKLFTFTFTFTFTYIHTHIHACMHTILEDGDRYLVPGFLMTGCM